MARHFQVVVHDPMGHERARAERQHNVRVARVGRFQAVLGVFRMDLSPMGMVQPCIHRVVGVPGVGKEDGALQVSPAREPPLRCAATLSTAVGLRQLHNPAIGPLVDGLGGQDRQREKDKHEPDAKHCPAKPRHQLVLLVEDHSHAGAHDNVQYGVRRHKDERRKHSKPPVQVHQLRRRQARHRNDEHVHEVVRKHGRVPRKRRPKARPDAF